MKYPKNRLFDNLKKTIQNIFSVEKQKMTAKLAA